MGTFFILMPIKKYYVIDLESKNGTFVNDFRLPPNVRVELKVGDRIFVGNQILEIKNEDSAQDYAGWTLRTFTTFVRTTDVDSTKSCGKFLTTQFYILFMISATFLVDKCVQNWLFLLQPGLPQGTGLMFRPQAFNVSS